MDASEPSTNGVSASNLYRLSSFFNSNSTPTSYSKLAKETVLSFESEMLQYPWLFSSFMPSIVAGNLGVRGVVVGGNPEDSSVQRIKAFEKQPRGSLGSFIRLREGSWLKERNVLLSDFGRDGHLRVTVCENGVCTEEREVGSDLEDGEDILEEALPRPKNRDNGGPSEAGSAVTGAAKANEKPSENADQKASEKVEAIEGANDKTTVKAESAGPVPGKENVMP
jgi:hypothetical protein